MKHSVNSHAGNSTAALVRELNLARIVDQIRTSEEISRAELTEAVGLSRQTVSAAVAQLIAAGLVQERQGTPGGHGRRPKMLSLSGAAGKVAAVQVEAHRLRVTTANLIGELEPHQDIKLKKGPTSDSIAAVLKDLSPLRTAAVAVPGVRHPQDGRIRLAPTAPALERLQLEQILTDSTGAPVLVENDVNLAAVGESWHGVAQGISNIAFLWIGPGVGLGMISEGEVLRGAHGAAGEIGFLVVESEPDGGSKTGLLERTVSEHAVLEAGAQAAKEGDTGLATVRQLNLETIFRVAELGDPKAARIEAQLVERIAAAALAVLSICDPELVVMGGSVAEAGGRRFVDGVRERMRGRVPAEFSIELTSLGDTAALNGGIAIALSKARRELVSTRGHQESGHHLFYSVLR
jgi:predicted NBD/HSP70 family sugar kinase